MEAALQIKPKVNHTFHMHTRDSNAPNNSRLSEIP